MGTEDIRRLADALGIGDVHQMNTNELIQSIHLEEGQLHCFSEAWSAPCKIGDCPYSDECSSNLLIEAVSAAV